LYVTKNIPLPGTSGPMPTGGEIMKRRRKKKENLSKTEEKEDITQSWKVKK
jgi:hypothetical protein